MEKSVVRAVVVTKSVTRMVVKLQAIGGGGDGCRRRVATCTAASLWSRSPSWWSAVPCAKNRRKRSERVVARRFQGPLKGLGQAGTGAGGGGGRPRAASHRRVLYAGSGSGPGSGRGRGWGWGSCGHISRRWVQWWVMWLVVNM